MKDVVIKSVGKGGKIVIWPVEQYLAEAHQQLSDEKYYKQQNTDHTVETAYKIYTFLTYLNNNYYINDDLFNFLKPHSPPWTPFLHVVKNIKTKQPRTTNHFRMWLSNS